ncbi:MAG: hypothetical protein ACOC1P_05000 [Minisyncoccales bacterium]
MVESCLNMVLGKCSVCLEDYLKDGSEKTKDKTKCPYYEPASYSNFEEIFYDTGKSNRLNN